MRTSWKKALSLLLALVLLLSFAACSKRSDDPSATTGRGSDKTTASEKTDPTDGKENSSEENDKPTETPLPDSEGLAFELNDDGESYCVSGIGICSDKTVIIPSAHKGKPVTIIRYQAFSGCSSLTSITIPDSVTSIGGLAFYGCSSLTSITIPDSVTSINSPAFDGCSSLKSITVAEDNDTYHSAGNCLIETKTKTLLTGCQNSVIPDDGSVTSIYMYAFSGSSLKSITIPDSVTSIGMGAFSDCSSLKKITVAEGNDTYHSAGNCLIETEGKTLVAGCQSSVIPDDGSVTSIDIFAFIECSGLKSITIPDSVTSIGMGAFSGCSSLKKITVAEGNDTYHSAGNCLIEGKTLIAGCQSSVIPDDGSVTSIYMYAFSGSSLKSITIPDSVTSIGSYAFSGCSTLASVSIGNGMTSIGSGAFSGCSSLTRITIPDSVTNICGYAFSDTAYYSNEDNWTDGVLYIGNHLIEANRNFSGAYTIKEGTKCIADLALINCENLKSVTIPNSVTSIGESAFRGCSSLTSITFEGTMEQWNVISKVSGWDSNSGKYTVHCSDGNIKK